MAQKADKNVRPNLRECCWQSWKKFAVAILANAPIPDGLGVSADLMAKVGVRFGAQDVFSCVKVLYASFVFHDVSHSS